MALHVASFQRQPDCRGHNQRGDPSLVCRSLPGGGPLARDRNRLVAILENGSQLPIQSDISNPLLP